MNNAFIAKQNNICGVTTYQLPAAVIGHLALCQTGIITQEHFSESISRVVEVHEELCNAGPSWIEDLNLLFKINILI